MIRLLRGSTNSPGRDVCFATLPYHIQLRIASWLSLSELANAARLSSQWSQLARAASQLVRMAVPADANVASGPLEETPVHAICRLNGAQKHILVLDLDETLVRVQPLSLGQQAASMKQAPPAVKTRPGSRAKRATLRLGRRLSQLQPHHVRGTRRFIVHAGTGDAKQKLYVATLFALCSARLSEAHLYACTCAFLLQAGPRGLLLDGKAGQEFDLPCLHRLCCVVRPSKRLSYVSAWAPQGSLCATPCASTSQLPET
mmetsp:Transcript_54928/g.119809  ORF Transcript_54928/g.119809 Transcript_54928/m.119809 type:complete len:258 (-) Transcript_54928:923-1696(-)